MNPIKFTGLAEAMARLSKDPSTKVGAVAINDDGVVLSTGFNGFPRGVNDDPGRYADRPTKYSLIAHAEMNLVAQAAYAGSTLKGSTVILTGLYPCSNCAKLLIQAGVKRIIAPRPDSNPRWEEDAEWSTLMFAEAGVEIVYLEETK